MKGVSPNASLGSCNDDSRYVDALKRLALTTKQNL